MDRLREKFLKENKGKHIRLLFANGFQLKCILIDYDSEVMEVLTNVYTQTCDVLVQIPFDAITAFVPPVD